MTETRVLSAVAIGPVPVGRGPGPSRPRTLGGTCRFLIRGMGRRCGKVNVDSGRTVVDGGSSCSADEAGRASHWELWNDGLNGLGGNWDSAMGADQSMCFTMWC